MEKLMRKSVLLSLIFILPLTIPASGETSEKREIRSEQKANKIKATVLYFHGKQRCVTCCAIERCVKELVATMDKNQVMMKVIDISDEKNKAIVQKYKVSWSSLIVEQGKKSSNLTEMGFRYARKQPEEFKKRLKEEIEKMK
ncbi:MAG: nitrophenyl compound nitroreductase subunit ArsF family protein [Bacteroidaceae bacterium]